ncbi:hypothetical protein M513_01203 [Trichuris suis]|uniref:Uncharacterized protein n=1 Tax=Trichuris suis TaxID=68888 RepID=A0A085ML74_9BILA|nr:hypothetical protein M513_01203 [Trichuris suis]
MDHSLECDETMPLLLPYDCESKQSLGCNPPCLTKEGNVCPSDNIQLDNAGTASFSMEVCPNGSTNPLQSSDQQTNSQNTPDEPYNGLPSRIRRHADSLQRTLFTLKEKEKQGRLLLLSKLAALEQMQNSLFTLTNRQKQLEDLVAAQTAVLGSDHGATTSVSADGSKLGKRNYAKSLEKVKVDLSKLKLRIVQANANVAVMESKLEVNRSSIQSTEERLRALQEAIRAKEEIVRRKMEAKREALKIKRDKEEERRQRSQKGQSTISQTIADNGANEQEQERSEPGIKTFFGDRSASEQKAAEERSSFELLQTENVPEIISSSSPVENELMKAIDGSADHVNGCQLFDASVQLKNTLPRVQDVLCKSSYEQLMSLTCPLYVIKFATLNESRHIFSAIDTDDKELISIDEFYNAETLATLCSDEREESEDSTTMLSGYYTNDLIKYVHTSDDGGPIGPQLFGICFNGEQSWQDHPMYEMLMNMQAERVNLPERQPKVKVQRKLSVPEESNSETVSGQAAKKSIRTLQAFGFEAISSESPHTILNERKRPLS